VRLAAISVCVSVVVFLLGGKPAHAGVRICHSRTLTAGDYAALLGSARRAAKGHELTRDLQVCMNPGNGSASIEAKPELQPDGTVKHLRINCERTPQPWKCAVRTTRHWQFSLPVAGGRRFDLQIPLEFTTQQARRVIESAFAKSTTLGLSEICGLRPGYTPTAVDAELLKSLRSTFAPRGTPTEGSIEVINEGINLSIDGFGLEFSPGTEEGEWQFRCWGAEIVIT
jgi:hypothetical protein